MARNLLIGTHAHVDTKVVITVWTDLNWFVTGLRLCLHLFAKHIYSIHISGLEFDVVGQTCHSVQLAGCWRIVEFPPLFWVNDDEWCPRHCSSPQHNIDNLSYYEYEDNLYSKVYFGPVTVGWNMSFLLFKTSPVPTDTKVALPKTGISEHPAFHIVMLPSRFPLWKCPSSGETCLIYGCFYTSLNP